MSEEPFLRSAGAAEAAKKAADTPRHTPRPFEMSGGQAMDSAAALVSTMSPHNRIGHGCVADGSGPRSSSTRRPN